MCRSRLGMVAAGLIIGVAVGWAGRAHFFDRAAGHRTEPNPANFSTPIRIIRCNNPGFGSVQYIPFRAIIDGHSSPLADPPEGKGEVWRIEFNDNRVLLFTTQQPIN